MKVEVWHLQNDGTFHKAHTLELTSVSDESTCELAFIHTKTGSITQIQEPEIRGIQLEDVVVLVDDDPSIEPRAYALTEWGCECEQPKFERVSFTR